MIKLICLMKRRPGLSFEDFIDAYEAGHARLAMRHMPEAKRYVRRYVTPFGDPAGAADCDAVTEIWFADQAGLDAAMARLGAPGIVEHLIADEERTFDRDRIRVLVEVEARETAI